MWEFLEVVLAICIAVWLLDRELPPRPGVLRLVRGDAADPDVSDAPAGRDADARLR
jgi:hypothetical protein